MPAGGRAPAVAARRPPVPSPCIGVCRLDARGCCEGCGRSGDEIARWLVMGEDERRRIMERVGAWHTPAES
jgi:predicted Fe-S protein YdhL (DUF1289 family)